MRISDWSSDVCSSDLKRLLRHARPVMNAPPIMLFHLYFRGYSGSHVKVWDYFNHALAAGWDARVYFTPQSLHDASNPWSAMPERVLDRYAPDAADALFIGGMDWLALDEDTARHD